MTTTTQDTRALIARLQVRLGEGTHTEDVQAWAVRLGVGE